MCDISGKADQISDWLKQPVLTPFGHSLQPTVHLFAAPSVNPRAKCWWINKPTMTMGRPLFTSEGVERGLVVIFSTGIAGPYQIRCHQDIRRQNLASQSGVRSARIRSDRSSHFSLQKTWRSPLSTTQSRRAIMRPQREQLTILTSYHGFSISSQ